MGAVNARAFALPGVRRMAMGFGVPEPIGYGSGRVGKTGGMHHMKIVELQPGDTIVRFGQKRLYDRSTRTDSMGAVHERGSSLSNRGLIGTALEGVWWLELAEFEKVSAYARAQRITVSAAVSALCVVPPAWSDLDVVVTARLMAPLLAWRGLPNPANVGGTHVRAARDLANKEITQLYIPGLANGDVVREALMWGAPTFLHPMT